MTRRILFIISNLDYSGPATQLALLARGLLREQFQPRVCVLGRIGPAAQVLISAGVQVNALGWNRLLDLNPLRQLRHSVATFEPEVIHTWQPASLRAACLAGGRGRLIGSSVLARSRPGAVLGRLQRWFLQRMDHVAVTSADEAQRYRQLGLAETKIELVPPGVAAHELAATVPATLRQSLHLPEGARLLMCVGPLEPHKGFQDALWAFDILRYLSADLHLVLVGEGSDRPRLEEFTRTIDGTDHIHFLGQQEDISALLAQAEVVWVPSRKEGGVNVALEALAVGRPVIASRVAGLADLIVDGETGLAIAPGDKVALARQTRVLLEDAMLRVRLAAAGRERARSRFAVAELVQRFVRLYEAALDPESARSETARNCPLPS